VDRCEPLLDDARKAAPAGATFECRDMRDLPWPGAFDAAFCMGNSFGYFDDAGNRAFLRALYDALRPGGRAVVETHFNADALLSQPLGKRWYEFGGLIMLHESFYDPATTRLTSRYLFMKDGQTERKEAVYQLYLYRELVAMMREAGFAEVETYGSLQREPYQVSKTDLFLVGRRA
jgi:SAM-dependent methyltransferase